MSALVVAHVDVGGTLSQWLLVAVAVFVAWRITSGGGGSAVQELSAANKVLTNRVHDLGSEVRDLKIENERLRQRTDFQAVLSDHERRAQERHTATLGVLELIAARLGPDHAPADPE